MNLYEPERNAIQIHHSFVKVTIFVMQKLMHCTMCTGYSTAIHACTVQCECSQQRRYTCIPLYIPLHVGFTILVHMSNCMQCLIFFTCVSFVLYLKFIKYQIYYGLIFYLSLNDSLNLKSPPAIAITCKTTQQIIEKKRKKERNKEQTATTNKSPKQHHIN